MRTCLAVLLLAASCVAAQTLFSPGSARPAPADTTPRGEATHPARFEMQGAASCASAACHNADAVTGYRGREYKLVHERFRDSLVFLDKHQQSYEVLFNEVSKRILKNLDPQKKPHDLRPERDRRCIGCHVHPDAGDLAAPTSQDDGPRFRLDEGVSCEACHGPAQHWLTDHFRPAWQQFDRAAKLEHGMHDTKPIVSRLRTCARCHIGDARQDVDHDLYAAGHPLLKFEAAGYHADYPRHWHPDKDKDPTMDARGRPTFEAELWALGRLVSAEAALKLLAARADRAADARRPWPEFAEYRCVSCHQDLSKAKFKPEAGLKAGQLPLSALHYELASEALELLGLDAEAWRVPFAELKREMAVPFPDRAKIAHRAQTLAGWVAEQLERGEGRLEPAKSAALAELLTKRAVEYSAHWETAYPYFHAIAAQDRMRFDLKRRPSAWPVARHRKHVEDPSGFDPASLRRFLDSHSHP